MGGIHRGILWLPPLFSTKQSGLLGFCVSFCPPPLEKGSGNTMGQIFPRFMLCLELFSFARDSLVAEVLKDVLGYSTAFFSGGPSPGFLTCFLSAGERPFSSAVRS